MKLRIKSLLIVLATMASSNIFAGYDEYSVVYTFEHNGIIYKFDVDKSVIVNDNGYYDFISGGYYSIPSTDISVVGVTAATEELTIPGSIKKTFTVIYWEMLDENGNELDPWVEKQREEEFTLQVTGIENVAGSYKKLTIPSSVSYIKEGCISECSNLIDIIVDNNNEHYYSPQNSAAIIEKETNTLVSGCAHTVIPNSVTKISSHAFYNCYGLSSITIPGTVETIGRDAFCYCI